MVLELGLGLSLQTAPQHWDCVGHGRKVLPLTDCCLTCFYNYPL